MKKLFTTIVALGLVAGAANAQRVLDLKVDSIYAPYELNSTSTNTPFSLNVQCSNVGTDTIKAGDTTFWSLGLFGSDAKLIIAFPQPQSSNVVTPGRVLTMDVAPGDTFHFQASGAIAARANQTAQVIGQIRAYAINRTDGIGFDNDPETTNNAKAYVYTWYNAEKWPLSFENQEIEALTLYPNPTSGTVRLSNIIIGGETSTVHIYDLNGKEVYNKQVANGFADHTINTTTFENGVYIVKVESGSMVNTAKLIVNH